MTFAVEGGERRRLGGRGGAGEGWRWRWRRRGLLEKVAVATERAVMGAAKDGTTVEMEGGGRGGGMAAAEMAVGAEAKAVVGGRWRRGRWWWQR